MNYDKVIEVDFDDCEVISKVVEFEEINDPSVHNIWMLYNYNKTEKVSMTYLIYRSQNEKYTSDVLYHSLDFIRLKLIRKKTTNIYINTSRNIYFFDLDFLTIESD